MPLKKCDKSGIDQFSTFKDSSSRRIADLVASETLLCIDFAQLEADKAIELFGSFQSDESQRIEVRLQPCMEES